MRHINIFNFWSNKASTARQNLDMIRKGVRLAEYLNLDTPCKVCSACPLGENLGYVVAL